MERRAADAPDAADVTKSLRRLTPLDVAIVGGSVGSSWRTLGHRLNFSVETMDSLEATCHQHASHAHVTVAEQMLTVWARLPSANVGRLALVLWEMGMHDLAEKLAP